MRPGLFTLLAWAATGCGENLTFGQSDGGSAPGSLSCLPNLDGQITAAEARPVLGRSVSFLVSGATGGGAVQRVDTAGVVAADGRRVWDWSRGESAERTAAVVAVPLAAQWYSAWFPGGEFVAPLDAAGRLDAIYSIDEAALYLHGSASRTESPAAGRTLLPYITPVALLRFPLSVGRRWTEVGEVRSGSLDGLSPWSQDDSYEVAVDESGELVLTGFRFQQVLRLAIKISAAPKTGGAAPTSVREVLFMFECFSVDVARATSPVFVTPDTDPGASFAVAEEVRRLGWF
ncbi:MAG: hypothetical protein HY903_19235 [Deltaproteobacteria bacterium]|nr:hypothetical protein [Deltaproteobacteria bacterium]